MKFIADLHIHSRYSLATSSQLVPEMLDLWGRKKGIRVVGTGDAVHPAWLNELKQNLQPASEGLYTLKKKLCLPDADMYGPPVSFILTTEISCIYKKDGKVRKVHNLILAPDFLTMEKIQTRLSAIGNIRSDGRPILGLDSRDLLEIVLEANSSACIIPAHIWTPWFSALGSKSGFDSIEECYGDLASHIFAVETGLSSDPPMNWRCSFLNRFSLVSNSDAHSPENLGREANLFDTDLSYTAIMDSLKGKDKGFTGTIEYFPEEGKYHLDGHRKCNIRWEPEEARKHDSICPVCGRKVTVGVFHRVFELADSDPIKSKGKNRRKFVSLTPLKNLLSEIHKAGPQSKKIQAVYESLLQKVGPEFTILIDAPGGELKKEDPRLAEGISRLREGKVVLDSGYDGVFGSVRVFEH